MGIELGNIGTRIRRDERPIIRSIRSLVDPVRSSSSPNSSALAKAVASQQEGMESLQLQISRLERELVALGLIQMTAPDGRPVAWIGINGPYQGGAFETLYVGANALSDPDNANIVANDSGVFINNTTFTLTLNGITSAITNGLFQGSFTGFYTIDNSTNTDSALLPGYLVIHPPGGGVYSVLLYADPTVDGGFLSMRDGSGSGGQDGFGRKILIEAETGYIFPSGGLGDSNGNEMLRFVAAANAVNDFAITNAATGNRPKLYASSGSADANVTCDLEGKGTGGINVIGADKLTIDDVIVPQFFYVPLGTPAGAAAADYDQLAIVPDAAEVVSVTERHASVASSGPTTVMVKKVPSGTALAAGTDTLSAGIDLTATVDTNQAGSLHGTPANYQLAAGDALGLVTTGTLTGVDSVAVTVKLKRI